MGVMVPIVEGDAEVKALPILLRRINEWQSPATPIRVEHPIRVRKERFLNRDEEFRRHLLLAAQKCGVEGWILILLDADDHCPARLGKEILERADGCISHRRISVVLANREYEAWFIAAAKSLQGHQGFQNKKPMDAEVPRNAKGWVADCLPHGKYREIIHQPAFSARMDLQQAFDGSRSFRKLCSEWRKQNPGPMETSTQEFR